MQSISAVLVVVFAAYALGCSNPKVDSTTYTTSNSLISSEVAFVVEFTVKCASGTANEVQALVGGEIVPVTSSSESNKLQVSWVQPNSGITGGSQTIKLYDESGANELRKAIRNGEESSVKSLAEINISHQGSSRKMLVTTEFMALVVMSLIFYGVCKKRNEVLA